ncbi:MAG: hypothetical protein HFH04_02850 [Dorea sp.]|nr:hypothetical protein [Dorea sp.]
MGCVTLLAIGGAFSEGRLYVLLRAKLHLSILTVTLEGLGICIPFENLKNTFPMAGTGCVQIKKLAVGFGYNRFLSFPQIDRLRQFTLMKMMHGEISAGQAAAKMPARQGQYWLAAGIQFESYGMVRGDVIASVIFGNTLRADLMGKAVLDLDAGSRKSMGENSGSLVLAHAVLLIHASFLPEAGLIAVTAMLGGESYLLSKDCHITGGFACYIWYDKEHKGDFVITLGGYHKSYRKPEHYPAVEPLGLKWQITNELLIQGNIYFALTPANLMAGGSMQMLFTAGCVHAWCIAQIDILLQWKPFTYDFSIDVSLGVRVKLLFTHVKLEIGCGLRLWGPEFSGIARVKLWIISFDIKFMKNDPGSTGKIDWNSFKESYLKPKTAKMTGNGAGFCGCSIQVGGDLTISVQTPAPYTAYRINRRELIIPHCRPKFGIYPCKEEHVESVLSIEVYTVNNKNPEKNETVDMSRFRLQEETAQVPCALWGTSEYKDNGGNWKQETFRASIGITLQVKNSGYPELMIPLSRETRTTGGGESIHAPDIEGKSYQQSEVYMRMAKISSKEVDEHRRHILENLGVETKICFGDGWVHAEKLQELFREAPYMETMGGNR